MFFPKQLTTFSSSTGVVRFNDTTNLGSMSFLAEQAWLDILDGWSNTVKPVAVTSQKAVGDGAYIARKFYSQGRVFMASGVIATNSASLTEQAWNALVYYAFPMNDTVRVTHYAPPLAKYSDVRVISDVRCTQFTELGFRFEVDLMSSESYLFDATATLSGTSGIVGTSTGGMKFPLVFPLTFNSIPSGVNNFVKLNNLGTAPTKPIVQITGPLDIGWRVQNISAGGFLSYDVALAAGQTLTIDFTTQTASIEGSSISGLVEGDWWDIQPGVNIIKLFGNFYSATKFTVTAKSAWR